MAEGLKKSAAATPSEGRQQNAVEEKVREIEGRLSAPLGSPTAQQTADYKAGWSDFVLTSEEDLVVKLPFATRDYVGRLIPVKNLHATDDVTVRPAGSDTIDGSTGDVLVGPALCYGYLCVAEGEWVELWRVAGGWVWAPTTVKTGAYTCTAMYELVRCNPAGGAFTVTLPAIASVDVGKMVCIKNVSSSTTAIYAAAASGQSILEPTHETHLSYESQIYCAVSATQWAIVADFYLAAVE